VIEAFLEVLGPEGTLLMPTFTQSAIYCDGEWITSKAYRPFHLAKSEVWVGKIPATFCQRPGVLRSVHPTHSVSGCGPLAEACLSEHRETDPPTGRRSPFGKLVDFGGKMTWFGADLATATFFHFLEDEVNLPYLKPALCRVEREDGALESVLVPRWLPGHRDFYRSPGETTKMYRRLIEKGLLIRWATLGLGRIKTIEVRPMYDLGMAALQDDPWLMLCDSRECVFCRAYNKSS
jgi:aminoglycoside N3'-acetyltransferase